MSGKSNGVYKHVEVSKTNCNRVKYHTHTMRRVLELEGFQTVAKDGCVYVQIGESWVTLEKIQFVQRSKTVKAAAPEPQVEDSAGEDSADAAVA